MKRSKDADKIKRTKKWGKVIEKKVALADISQKELHFCLDLQNLCCSGLRLLGAAQHITSVTC